MAQIDQPLLPGATSGTWEWDIPGGLLRADAEFAALYGVDPAALEAGVPASTFFSAIHVEDRPRIRIAVAGMLAGAEIFSKEYRVLTPDGAVVWVHARGRGLVGDNEEPVRFTGLLVDVTERKRTEERLRVAQSAGGVGTFEYIDGYATASVSDEFCRLLGFLPAPNLPVKTINSVLTPGESLLIPDAKSGLAPTTLDGTFRIARSDDGSERWITRRGEILREGAGFRLIGVIYDVTATKQQETELRELNDTLESRVEQALAEKKIYADVVERSPAAVTVLGPDFQILAINRANVEAFEAAFGRRPEVGDPFLSFFEGTPEHLEQQRTIWTRALNGETFVVLDEFGFGDLERRSFEVRFSPLLDRKGKLVGASSTSYDVTDRVRAEAQLMAAQDQLRQAQKMEAMGQLTGGVAHDFNNLLTPIFGSLDILQRRGVGTEREQRLIAAAFQSAERARTLVQRLLAFARRQPLQPTAVDIGALVTNMAELIVSTTGPQINLKLSIEDLLAPAVGDPNQLEMALLNLGVNARDAMPEGGTLRISASLAMVGEAHHLALPSGRYVKLAVADSGCGMDEATLARAVEPFFSTKGIGQGTGLGLSMVDGLARQLGGALAIRSEVGRGTEIELWLPVADTVPEDVVAAEREVVGSGGGLVLLVDDEDLVRLSTADLLIELGYEVVEARSAEEALSFVDDGLNPDILVTDHLMPGITGTELVSRMVLHNANIRALVISGYAEGDGIPKEYSRLAKPFRKDELSASLAALHEQPAR